LEKIKHGSKTLAECGGIHGVDDTSSFFFNLLLQNQKAKINQTNGTSYPLVKRIQVCSNKGPGPHQKGDNHRNVRKGWGHLKILFLRTMKPETLNFT
jgi:hypothetical protein